jgi:hypothetical protein
MMFKKVASAAAMVAAGMGALVGASAVRRHRSSSSRCWCTARASSPRWAFHGPTASRTT